MSSENIPDPSSEEIEDVLNKIERDSEPAEPGFLEIHKAVNDVAAQMGDTENIGDRPLHDLIEQLKPEGWYFVGIMDDKVPLDMGKEEDRETKIVGQGNQRYIFYRDKEIPVNNENNG